MRLVKALVGGVLGGLLGAALIIGVEGFALKDAPWLALFVGVFTGMGVRIMGKSDKPGPCYLCGAIAAALTLVAFVGATLATTKMLQAQVAKETQLPLDITAPDATPPAAEPADDAAPAEEPAAEAEAPTTEPAATESPETPAEPTAEEPATEDPPAEAPVAEEEVVEETVEVVEPAAPREDMANKPPGRVEDFSLLSFAFIGIGALIAYELGRSCGSSKPA